ncbi:hypothetical protein AVEN_219599-1 [Araneus ventricosus]|uniref:Uncharacterized protein n=1 Tax=Araneus ventricosus TaxID=182803 RepID=A0A4Y2X188_ARAVE|nr:hypothetical protein AVEN_219599-1 [Araneus ventricosus]
MAKLELRGVIPRHFNFQPIHSGGSFTETPCKPHYRSLRSLKQTIYISSKMEYGKEKAIARWELAQRNGKAGIPTNSKSNTPCADSNLEPRCEGSGISKELPRLGPRDEARKSEIRLVREETRATVGGIEERW